MSETPRIVVTGAGGFIGGHVMEALWSRGVEAIGISRTGNAFMIREADIRERTQMMNLLAPGDVVLHLASTRNPSASASDPIADVNENLISSIQLFEACAASKISKVVIVSSGGTVYGEAKESPIGTSHPTDPISVHGATKLAIEKFAQVYAAQFGFSSLILRCANAYGPGQTGSGGQGIIGRALMMLLTGKTLEVWGDGTTTRDFIYAKDVAEAVALSCLSSRATGVLNIGTGIGTTINDVVRSIQKVTGKRLSVKYGAPRGLDVSVNVLDISRTTACLSWRPVVPLEEGIAQSYKWAVGELTKSGGHER